MQGAVSKKKEFERLSSEGKVSQGEAVEISNRTNTLSYALMAEINTFHYQRVKDMKTAHQHFLQEQITFYQKVRSVHSVEIEELFLPLRFSVKSVQNLKLTKEPLKLLKLLFPDIKNCKNLFHVKCGLLKFFSNF